jgi:release factor glutamine methyltransferase
MNMNIGSWLNNSKIDRLDAELLLAHVLEQRREWILAHTEYELDEKILKQLNSLASKVLQNTPLAYILGYKEFYGRKFIVTPDVLIPRPETEQLVEVVLSLRRAKQCGNPDKVKTGLDRHADKSARDGGVSIIDVGCGSGCIGITLKLERPELDVTLSDISENALKVAKQNWLTLCHCETSGEAIQSGSRCCARDDEVRFIQSDLLKNVSGKFDIIVANLPYVSRKWQVSPSTKYEPSAALFADDDGQELIKKLLEQTPKYLAQNGYVALEADKRQHRSIIAFAEKLGFNHTKTQGLVILLQRN